MMPVLKFSRLLATFARSSLRAHDAATRTTIITGSSRTFSSILLSSPNNSNNNNISYQLPDHIKPFTGIVGDQKLKRSPLLDGALKDKRNNFAILQSSINGSMTVFYNPPPPTFDHPSAELDLSIAGIMRSILQKQQQQQTSYELPTADGQAKEKLADYYKHKHKRFTHLLWVRHRKMKKHQRLKWRKKNLAMIKRRLLERNIAKEKHFRAELLAQVREAENFNAEEYVAKILRTIDNVPKAETPQEKYQRYRDLIRKNRTQTNLVMPKFDD